MAYDFLKKLFGETKEGEEPKKMSYVELESAIDADKNLQLVNLKDGGYVSKDKFDAKNTELSGVKEQLSAANDQIRSFKGTEADIDSVRKTVSEWEEKYRKDTEALNKKLSDQARSHAEDMFFSKYQFTSKAAENGIRSEFRDKNFSLSDDGVFQGGKEYIDSLMQQDDYKGAFKTAEKPKEEANESQVQQNVPYFAQSASGVAQDKNNTNLFNFGFNHLHQAPKEPANQ